MAMLLSSGATVTWAHHSIISSNCYEAIAGLAVTVLLGVLFTLLQGMEYYEAPFAISGLARTPAIICKRAVFGTYRTTSHSRPFVGLARVLRGIGEL